MPAKVLSAVTIGLESFPVEVEVDTLSQGLHNFTLVGLPDTAVKESRDRVGSAIKNSGFKPPHHFGRITVNLAPADIPKNGPIYDLPVALGFLLATGQLQMETKGRLFVGELALDGTVRRIHGILSIALYAKDAGIQELYVPEANALEASLVEGIAVYPITSLFTLAQHVTGIKPIAPFERPEAVEDDVVSMFDIADVSGQEHAKRALEIAAAGGHNILLVGPPGSGKTLLAKALPSILPKLSFAESLDVTKIFSVAGQLTKDHTLLTKRPFRTPHHSASSVSLIGGGSIPRPGEVSLAHRGVLFLDEFAEFPKSVLENLRQPLEDGHVTVSRAKGTIRYPARFTLVAAMNPCPCGYTGDPERMCSCLPYQVEKYRARVSGPILDRIDLQIEVPRMKIEKLENHERGEASDAIRARVEAARAVQIDRLRATDVRTNSEMRPDHLREHCALDEATKTMLREAAKRLSLSARGYHRILKVARTIADLSHEPQILALHVAEALQYRFRSE